MGFGASEFVRFGMRGGSTLRLVSLSLRARRVDDMNLMVCDYSIFTFDSACIRQGAWGCNLSVDGRLSNWRAPRGLRVLG